MNNKLTGVNNTLLVHVSGGDLCTAAFMGAGGLVGGAVGGYLSGGLAAAGGFSLGVTLGQDAGEFFCSSNDDE
ncbi:hypothetical protein [Alteromonas flava]|uniref:hypothetical protein n=1 Tax=Alteromonas flava TaxID=2048003 RepID=UPI000C2815C0|nr:hypothetical protein [Alteromonas flava]